ncbi:MAG TPA: SDR family NAD(P)-dependent oxidoreductase [Candidatus Kapabacteria bacterium]
MQTKWKYAIVVGASSGIGEEVTYELARRGVSVALVGRRTEELQRVATAAEIGSRGSGSGSRCLTYTHDVTNYSEIPELFQRITKDLGGLDLIVYSSGVMPKIEADEYNFAKDRSMIEVNVLGGIAWLNEAAMRFQNVGGGSIVGISSIAGERGRRGNPVYNTSKAAFSTYLESLRNRLSQYGVNVTTIKPGVIDTPMIKGLNTAVAAYPVADTAKQIVDAAAKGVIVKYVPSKFRIVSIILHLIPSFIFRRLNF